HDGLELDRGQPPESGLPTPPVIGPLDPGHDGDPKFLAGGPGAAVEDVLLEQREEALHGRVVAGRADAAHGSDHVVTVECTDEFPASKLRPSVRVDDAPGHAAAPRDGVV